jgi:hypothetical protein
MLWVVLPVIPALAIDVVDVVLVEIVCVVDGYVAAVVPIAIAPASAPNGCTNGHSSAPRQGAACHIPWIGNRWIRVGRLLSVNDCRIVRRNVNRVRSWRLNHNGLAASFHRLSFHFLLCAGFQISRALRLCPHALDRCHHIGLLGKKSVPQIGGPLDVF